MRYIRPDFFDDFKCIAQNCRHSCCVGWEIDIDDDSLDYYMSLDGELGRQLRENIDPEPEVHFRLCENERCPFLEKNGLCRLINELGEESLCNICAEHPRFYNCFDDREEAGLGLCCEEAARLLLDGEGSLKLIAEGGTESEEEKLRGQIFSALADESQPLESRFKNAMAVLGEDLIPHKLTDWADILLGLERLDESWTEKLLILREKGEQVELNTALNDIRYERLCQYFVYRHLLTSDDYGAALEFCILATEIIAVLDSITGFDIENTRLFSSEIEYSDENMPYMLEKIKEIRQ